MQHYNWLLSKLDAFIRKYYLNQLLRGSLILFTCLLAYILLVSVGEYYLYLPVWAKVSIISAFVALGGSALVFWVILPLARMGRMGKTLSHEEAALIVGRHFPEISDKLLNVLQLKSGHASEASRELIEASIDQKASQISVVPITRAIDLSKNRRYLPFLLPVALAGLFMLIAAPNVFRDAGTRLLQPTKTFEKPAPFTFNLVSVPLSVTRNADYTLKVSVTGNALPSALFVEVGDERIPATALSNHVFQYTFRNVTEPVSFRLFAAGFYSRPYKLQVAQTPVLKAIRVQIDYPDYTGRKDEIRTSLGDLNIPVGTRVGYALMADYTDGATLQWGSGASVNLVPHSGKLFSYQHQFMQDTSYTIFLHNRQTATPAGFQYNVQVIPDQYPVVQVQEFRDTVTGRQIVLTGTAGDDYGITRVFFHYDISDAQGHSFGDKSFPLAAGGTALVPFQKYFDLQALNLQPGQKVSYYVEAFDNDGVHGPKAARSMTMVYAMYTPRQLDSSMNVNARQINAGLSSSAQQSKEIQEDLKETKDKMLQSTEMSFEQQQNLKELAEKQEQLQTQMEAAKKRFEEQVEQSKQKEYSEDVREKQEEMKKQMDNLLNNELKEQMKKLQELMAKLNKEDAQKTMDQMQEQNKLFQMDMERMKELMKQLEAQMRMEDLANKADKLAQQQQDLKKVTDAQKKSNDALAKEQQDLKKELDKTMNEDMKELQKLSNGMERRQDVSKPAEQGKKAGEQMQQSEQQLEQNNSSKSSESQQNAAQNLQQMAASLRAMAGGMNIQQIQIDIRATRQLLTNLIRLSFDQEKLMNGVRTTSPASQTYFANQREQARLYGASHMIRDSLFALSKRIYKLAPTINKETGELEKSMLTATTSLEGRNIGDALTRQQYVMTHANNLALMLNEVLAHLMQMQSQSSSSGSSGSCTKPGGGSPKPGAGQQLADIITQQQNLGNAMQQAGKKPGQGKKPGEGKDGKDGKEGKEGKEQGKSGENGAGSSGQGSGTEGNNEYGDAEKLARFAAQQAAIRRQLQDLQNRLNGTGMGNTKEMREIQQQMDRNETDLVNRRLTSEFLMRQQEILTRLLQAEKALREQEQDDKRASNAGKEISRPVPPELQRYLQNRQQLLELYRTIPPQLKPYYKQMVNEYFRNIGTR
jgi:hypothetical protein